MSRPTRNTLRGRLEGLEQARQRCRTAVVAIYDADIEGDAESAAESFEKKHGWRPVILLPHNWREAL